MSMNTALSGLRAANTDLSVTGNNIANASTTGFKQGRTEFGDVYASSVLGIGTNTPGSGVLVTDIAQQFDQGNITFTDNSLDLAISGTGFFVLSDGGATTFTRSGVMGLDREGYIVSNSGARLQGFPVNEDGVVSSGVLQDLQIPTQDISPVATTTMSTNFNLNSGEKQMAAVTDGAGDYDPALFDPADPDTYNDSSSMTVYDSQGNPHTLTTYYVKVEQVGGVAQDNTWRSYSYLDAGTANQVELAAAGGSGGSASEVELVFNTDGSLNAAGSTPANVTTTYTATGAQLGNGTSDLVFTANITGSTQFAGDFSVAAISQNGFAPGRLTGVEVDDSGVVFARYTNGEAQVLGQVALAKFANTQGLGPIGDTAWVETFESGQPVFGAPQTGSLGAIQSGALEESNVELSEELVGLILAQRNYQANAKTIQTVDTVTQAILNLR